MLRTNTESRNATRQERSTGIVVELLLGLGQGQWPREQGNVTMILHHRLAVSHFPFRETLQDFAATIGNDFPRFIGRVKVQKGHDGMLRD